MQLASTQKQRREAGGGAEGSGRGKEPRLYAARDEAAATAFKAQESLAGLQSLPLAERLAAAGDAGASGRQRWAQHSPLEGAVALPGMFSLVLLSSRRPLSTVLTKTGHNKSLLDLCQLCLCRAGLVRLHRQWQ